MSSLRALGLAAAIGLTPACEKPAEQPKQEVVAPTQEVISAECERFRAAIGLEVTIERMASDPAAWKLFPAPLAKAAWDDAHVESMAAAAALPKEDQGACFRAIKHGE